MGHTYWLRAARVDIKQSNVRITSCSQVAFVWGYLKPIDMLCVSHTVNQIHQKNWESSENLIKDWRPTNSVDGNKEDIRVYTFYSLELWPKTWTEIMIHSEFNVLHILHKADHFTVYAVDLHKKNDLEAQVRSFKQNIRPNHAQRALKEQRNRRFRNKPNPGIGWYGSNGRFWPPKTELCDHSSPLQVSQTVGSYQSNQY